MEVPAVGSGVSEGLAVHDIGRNRLQVAGGKGAQLFGVVAFGKAVAFKGEADEGEASPSSGSLEGAGERIVGKARRREGREDGEGRFRITYLASRAPLGGRLRMAAGGRQGVLRAPGRNAREPLGRDESNPEASSAGSSCTRLNQFGLRPPAERHFG